MKRISILLFTLGLFYCSTTEKTEEVAISGSYSGVFKHGNFSDTLNFQI